MIDHHVHLERGPYTELWLNEFIKTAVDRNIDKLYLLEHSHRFIEFKDTYDGVKTDNGYGIYQKNWLSKKFNNSLKDYQQFISKMREKTYPIEIYFGLEICYFPDKEENIKDIISDFNYDFLTGSIHWIDGWGFDHKDIKEYWSNKDVDNVYKKYYNYMIDLVNSGIFNILAHPDSIKCFDYYPNSSLEKVYHKLAKSLKENDVKVEFNNGLFINYGHSELGMNRRLLKILLDNGVNIVTSTDAHRPEDVGKYIKEANEIIFKYRS